MNNLDHLFVTGDELDGVLLVDFSQISLATAMVTFGKGEKITTDETRHLILSTLKHNVVKFKSEGFTEIIICVDNSKSGYWRRQEFDYYKRNRAIAREAKDDFDWEGYFEGLGTTLSEIKEFMPYTVIDVKHAEADDAIAVLARYLATTKRKKVRIISSDGDFTQLHAIPNVDQYSPIQKKFVECKTSSPEEDKLTKIIKGDKKDCVASIKVKGDFYLSDIDRNTPMTSTQFITDCVGKTEDELLELFKQEISDKTYGVKAGKKWILTELTGYFDDEDEASFYIEQHGKDESIELVHKYRVKDVLTTFYGMDETKVKTVVESRTKEQLVELMAKIRMKRFKENQILIDFEFIRQDIQDAIMAEFESYKPAPRGKMYSYFVTRKLTKLLPDISMF